MDKGYFGRLLQLYFTDEATQEQRDALFLELEKRDNDEEWQQLMIGMTEITNEEAYDPEHWKPLIQRIIQPQPKIISISGRSGWYKWVAAAVIIIAIGMGSYFAIVRNNGKPLVAKTAAPVKMDIAPGKDGAILTLANGKKVVLDNAADGKITDFAVKHGNEVSYLNGQSPMVNVLYNTMTTPRGRQFLLVLADGTKVWLNAASSITYPTAFIGNQRKVSITGEAYFEVAHDATKPFHVSVNGMDVQVLGTHFNINSYSDEESMQTTLLEGSVKISFANSKQSVFIKPGEQASLSKNGTLSTVKNVDVEKVIAWKNGWFEFDNTDLQAILRQISRWYDVDVVYEKSVTQEKFGGRINRNLPLSTLLESLKSNGVQFKLEGKRLIVNP